MELNITKKDKILVVSPHQDDETIGCGGLLAKYGKQCDILLLADGKYEMNGYKEKDVQAIRDKELDNTAKLAKVKTIYKLNIPNDEVRKHKEIIEKFDITKYSFIFVPNKYESHDDHSCVAKIFSKMRFAQKSNAKILEYEVWTPLRCPTTLFDISDVIEIKKKMIKMYKSQLKQRDYYNSTIGLNSYRGMQGNVKYAEAYMDTNYSGIKKFIYEKLPNKLKLFIKNKLS